MKFQLFLSEKCDMMNAMDGMEVYFVSEIGESLLGTVKELLNPIDPYSENLQFTFEILDIVREIAFNEDRLDFSMPVTIELREPQRP